MGRADNPDMHAAHGSVPEVWFAIPSANPEKCRKTLPVWREMGYRVAVLQNWKKADIPADLVVWSDHYPGWPQSINILCRDVVPRTAPIVVSGGDDMLPDPNVTADRLAAQFIERFPDTFGVMQPVGDGFMSCNHYCGSPWLGRAFIDCMNGGAGPMWGAYTHNWADNELHWVAKGMGVLWQRPDLTHHHDHFTRTGEAKPDYWNATVAPRDQHDVELFLSRKWQRFPGHEPIGAGYVYDHDRAAKGDGRIAENHWANLYGPLSPQSPWLERIRAALDDCERSGRKRIALYGAGTHTRSVIYALPHIDLTCIVDDNPAMHGKRLMGFPVVSADQAKTLRLDAVILSSNSHEQTLWQNAAPLREAGVPVIRLYADMDDDEVIRSTILGRRHPAPAAGAA